MYREEPPFRTAECGHDAMSTCCLNHAKDDPYERKGAKSAMTFLFKKKSPEVTTYIPCVTNEVKKPGVDAPYTYVTGFVPSALHVKPSGTKAAPMYYGFDHDRDKRGPVVKITSKTGECTGRTPVDDATATLNATKNSTVCKHGRMKNAYSTHNGALELETRDHFEHPKESGTEKGKHTSGTRRPAFEKNSYYSAEVPAKRKKMYMDSMDLMATKPAPVGDMDPEDEHLPGPK